MTDRVREYYDSVDSLDASGAARYFAVDGTFRLGNFPEVKGIADIEAANQAFFDTIAAIRHDFTSRYSDGAVDIVEADVTYTLDGGAEVTIPGIAVLEHTGDLISASRSYVDIGPLRELGQAASSREWVERFISAVDTLDVDRMLPFFAESGTFTYGNNSPMVGHEGIRAELVPFHAGVAGISHDIRNCFPCGPNVIIAEYLSTYIRHDGRSLTLPGVGVFEIADGLIQAYRVYADVAPVFETATPE